MESVPSLSNRSLPKQPLFRRIYDWTIHWCGTRYAVPALCLVAFAEASFFLVPPDVLLIAMTFAHPKKWARNAAVCLAASLAGGLFGWTIGFSLWQFVGPWLFAHVPGFHQELFDKVKTLYHEHAFLTILCAPFCFIPYKIFTISAGIFGIPIPTLLIASAIGRGARFFLVTGSIRLFGHKARTVLEKYFKQILLGCTLTAVLVVVAVKLLHPH